MAFKCLLARFFFLTKGTKLGKTQNQLAGCAASSALQGLGLHRWHVPLMSWAVRAGHWSHSLAFWSLSPPFSLSHLRDATFFSFFPAEK